MAERAIVQATDPPVVAYDPEHPWRRQPCDGDAQWAAFCQFLLAPMPRSVTWLARRLNQPHYLIQRWHDQLGWKLRAERFDSFTSQHFEATVTEIVEARATDYTERHMSLLEQCSELAGNELQKYVDASRANTGIGLLTARELITLVDTTIKLERLIRGQATENVKSEIDLSKLSTEDLLLLQDLQDRAGIR